MQLATNMSVGDSHIAALSRRASDSCISCACLYAWTINRVPPQASRSRTSSLSLTLAAHTCKRAPEILGSPQLAGRVSPSWSVAIRALDAHTERATSARVCALSGCMRIFRSVRSWAAETSYPHAPRAPSDCIDQALRPCEGSRSSHEPIVFASQGPAGFRASHRHSLGHSPAREPRGRAPEPEPHRPDGRGARLSRERGQGRCESLPHLSADSVVRELRAAAGCGGGGLAAGGALFARAPRARRAGAGARGGRAAG